MDKTIQSILVYLIQQSNLTDDQICQKLNIDNDTLNIYRQKNVDYRSSNYLSKMLKITGYNIILLKNNKRLEMYRKRRKPCKKAKNRSV